VEKALSEAGAIDGDEIRIGGKAFEFEGALERDPEVAFIEDPFDQSDEVGDVSEPGGQA